MKKLLMLICLLTPSVSYAATTAETPVAVKFVRQEQTNKKETLIEDLPQTSNKNEITLQSVGYGLIVISTCGFCILKNNRKIF